MSDRPAALPRRPLTVGEVLDAAAELVRLRAWPLLAVGVALALVEQAALYPIREAMGYHVVTGFAGDFEDAFGPAWLLLAVGFTFESAIIVILGVSAGRSMAADLSDTPGRPIEALKIVAAHWWMLLLAPFTSGLVFTVLTYLLGGMSAEPGIAFLLGLALGSLWLIVFVLFGLTGAVSGLDRRVPFAALGRASALSFRGGMRVTWVRLLGFFAWALLRLGFSIGVLSLFDYVTFGETAAFIVVTAGTVIANAAAYVFLAALDAAALAEIRFRTEGLDIWLSRAEQHSRLTPDSVAAAR